MLVYVAGPYTKGDVAINVNTMVKMCDRIAGAGFGVYCPLLTHFWHIISPHPYQFWINLDDEILKRCDCLLRIEGESKGADDEVAKMTKLGNPVFNTYEELINYYGR